MHMYKCVDCVYIYRYIHIFIHIFIYLCYCIRDCGKRYFDLSVKLNTNSKIDNKADFDLKADWIY